MSAISPSAMWVSDREKSQVECWPHSGCEKFLPFVHMDFFWDAESPYSLSKKSYFEAKTSYIIVRVQYKMKTWSPLFKSN